MADPVYLTINEFPGTGAAAPTVVDFNFAGGYISPAHVKAEIFNPVTYLRTPVTVTDANFVTDYRLSLPVVVPTGSILRVYRDTPKDQPLVDFTNGARIAENNLDLVARQAVFVAAESTDQIEATQAADVLQAVEVAALSAATAQVEAGAAATSATLSQAAAQEGASIAGGFALAAAASAAEASAVRADLAIPASGKGAEMVGFKYPSAWAAATNLQLRGETFVLAQDGGATPDGSDVSAELQAMLNAGRVVVLQAGKTYVAANLVSATGAGLVCLGGRAKIAVPAGSGIVGLSLQHNNFTLDGVDFDGGNMGPYDGATPPALGTRIGVNVGLPYGSGHQQTGCTLRNCDVYGFDRVGIQGLEVVVGYSAGKRVVYDNVNCYNNHYNWSIDQNHEYCSFTNCYGYKGQIGVQLIGGNNMFTASMFTYNWINCQLMPGANQQHGAFVGCSFNHANAYGLDALNVVNGEVFNGCMFWYAPIRLRNCAGVAVTNSQIANSHITVDGGGVNWIDDNYMPSGLNKTLVGVTFTSFRRNRTTQTETSYATVYGDAFFKASASTYAYPISWNVTADALFPLSFSDTRWHGENLPALATSGFISVPRTGQFRVEASIAFSTLGAAEKVTLKAVVVRASVDVETVTGTAEFTAGQTECVVKLGKTLLLQSGDAIQLKLKTRTATGITIPAGAIDFQLVSVD